MYKQDIDDFDKVIWYDEKCKGKRYGRLIIKKKWRQQRKTWHSDKYVFLCMCDCGEVCIKEQCKVTQWLTKSCWCLSKEFCWYQHRKAQWERGFNEKYNQYKSGAKKRWYDFQLSKEEFAQVVTQPCIYCWRSNTQVCRKWIRWEFYYTWIDRYDNTKWYIVDNIVPCCARCNRIKTDIPIDELEKHLELIMSRKDMWKRTA